MKFTNTVFLECKTISFLCGTYNFSNKELPTTDAELKAIAADDIQGWRKNPKELNIPAAIGIPNKL